MKMKNLISIALVVVGSVSRARSLKPSVLQSQLTFFRFQEKTFLASADINYGNVELNLRKKQLTLTLGPAFRCPPNMFCAQVMPEAIVYQLKLQKPVVGSCGEMIYTADNQAPFMPGSSLIQVEVTDNS